MVSPYAYRDLHGGVKEGVIHAYIVSASFNCFLWALSVNRHIPSLHAAVDFIEMNMVCVLDDITGATSSGVTPYHAASSGTQQRLQKEQVLQYRYLYSLRAAKSRRAARLPGTVSVTIVEQLITVCVCIFFNPCSTHSVRTR